MFYVFLVHLIYAAMDREWLAVFRTYIGIHVFITNAIYLCHKYVIFSSPGQKPQQVPCPLKV